MPLALSRRYCRDGNEHIWRIHQDANGNESASCAGCMVPLSMRELLRVYIDRYGGKVLP